jgi:hemolysin activation/secretion protein
VNLRLLALLLLLSPALFAQTYEQVAPRPLPKIPTLKPELPALPPAVGEDKIALDSLRGLVLVPRPELVIPAGMPETNGLQLIELTLLDTPAFREVVAPFLNQPMSMKRLNELLREIVLYYRRLDRPVVSVVVPEQEVVGSVIQLLVLEGQVGQVNVTGARWFRPSMIRDQIRLTPRGEISNSALLNDLDWINSNPFRSATIVFAPGTETALTDVEVRVRDRFPLRTYLGYEDSGNDITGDERLIGGLNWGNAFGLDHQANYQYTGSTDIDTLSAHAGSYVIPLPWRHRVTLLGSYGNVDAKALGDQFTTTGVSWQAGARYLVPLPRWGAYQHEASAGFDFKQSNSNIAFGGNQFFGNPTDITAWLWNYTASLPDTWGKTSARLTVTYSPGGLTDHSRDSDYRATRSNAESEFTHAVLTVERLQKLPADFTYLLRGTAQIADGNLLPSEQLGLGGYSTVRGYEEREANGDEGWLLTNELRTPPVSLGQVCGLSKAADQLQFLAFWDYGQTSNINLLAGEDPHVILSSVGPGVRYTIAPWLSARFDYGWQLTDSGASDGRRSQRAHLGLTMSY